MLLTEVLNKVREKKPVSRAQLRVYITRLKIQPIGCAQRPQPYPNDTADKILAHLGFAVQTNGHAGSADDGKVLSIKSLKRQRELAGKK